MLSSFSLLYRLRLFTSLSLDLKTIFTMIFSFLSQELMFTLKGFDNTAWFLTCYQFFVYGILSFVHLGFAGLDQRRYHTLLILSCHSCSSLSRASYRSYILLALLTVTTMGLSNYAVVYLNYP